MKTIHILTCLVFITGLALVAGCGGGGDNPVIVGDINNDNPEALDWAAIQRLPVSETLHSIDAVGDVRIAVGEGGTILFQHGNRDWQSVDRFIDDALRRVIMIDEKRALILGNNVILRTEDAGVAWKIEVQSPSTLRDLAVKGKNAIAVGNSTILISDDSGETWSSAQTFPPVTYDEVAFQTEDIATAMMSSGNMFRSVNSGKDWTEVAVAEVTESPTDLAFFTKELGVVALANPAEVMWTSDGGDTWDKVVSFGQSVIRHFEVIDDEKGFAILNGGQIHVTENGGKSWAFESAAPVQIGQLTCLSVANANDWTAVGSLGNVVESITAGASWKPLSTGRVGRFSSVAFIDESIGVAAFDPRIVLTEKTLRTTDGGATWNAVDGVIKRPECVVFNDGVGLLVGSDEVSKSLNDGFSWVDISPEVEDGLHSAAIIDVNTYVICGDNSKVLQTTDGGSTWDDRTFETSGTTRFEDVAFFPQTTTGVMVSQDRSFRSTDNGLNWQPVNLRARAIACASADVAVAVGAEILRSTDGGQTWNIVGIPDETLRAVAFASASHGVAVGSRGMMVETVDGGSSWNPINRETSVRLSSVNFRNGVSAVAGGDAGALLLGISP